MHLFCNTIARSLTSSNSSFTECVRKHLYPHSPLFAHHTLSSNTDNPECTSDWQSGEICDYGSSHPSLRAGTNYSFLHVSFTQSSSYSGGAICMDDSSINSHQRSSELLVRDSVFNNCHASHLGGAIFLQDINKYTITSSLFFSCTCSATVNGGGGIHSFTTHTHTAICAELFLSSLLFWR